MIIDTHAHLYDKAFAEDFDVILDNLKAKGVGAVLMPNIDCDSIKRMHQISEEHPHILPMMGLHPCYVKENFKEELEQIKGHVFRSPNRYCAIGEIGIDLYWDQSYLESQKTAFESQIKWAIELNKPIAIHVRDAFDETFDVLSKFKNQNITGVFHCFTGTAAQCDYILTNFEGFSFGIGGVVTYKNSGLKEVVGRIPIHKIVLETDAPYLPPVPFRGKRNEPSFIPYIIDHLVDCYSLDEEEIKETTTINARKLFKLENWNL